MRIGVDARCLEGRMTGIGRYVREILLRLDTIMPEVNWVLYSRNSIDLEWPSSRWKVSFDTNPLSRKLPGVIWLKSRLQQMASKDQLDAFWAVATLSPRTRVPIVATVHDLNHMLVADTMTPVNRFAYRRWFENDVKNANRVVANSHGTAERLFSHLGVRVDGVALPGSRWRGMGQGDMSRRLVDQPYVLAVSTQEPRKNLSSLVEAFSRLKAEGHLPGHALVLAGAEGWGRRLRFDSEDSPGWLRRLGYVDDSDMSALMTHADLFVQPSIYEGFGMPASEAVSFGVRVVATDIPELREAAGHEGVFVKPDAESIADGILHAISLPKPDPRILHTWDDAAESMRKIFSEVVGTKVQD